MQVMEDGEDGDADAEDTEADAELEAKLATMANERSRAEGEHHSGDSEDGDGGSKSAIPALLQVRASSLAHMLYCLSSRPMWLSWRWP